MNSPIRSNRRNDINGTSYHLQRRKMIEIIEMMEMEKINKVRRVKNKKGEGDMLFKTDMKCGGFLMKKRETTIALSPL